MVQDRFRVPAEHPCLDGHFPGRPVVPGVVLLDAVFGLSRARCGAEIAAIEWVKFLSAVLPGEEVAVAFEPRQDGVGFFGRVDGRLVLQGVARLAASSGE